MKSFINVNDGSNLTDISPILTCIRTLGECDVVWNEDKSKYFKSMSMKQLENENDTPKENGFYFAVSLKDGACLYTSSAISDHLGYPKDMLNGQCFMNFIFQKDHITFANHLTEGLNVCFNQNKTEESNYGMNSFFCRLRVYQGLKFGYPESEKKTQYKPFKITLHINELMMDDLCVEKSSATLCVKATATAVSSAYTIPEEIPAMTYFSTRHTASCHFNHVDFSAIPYLGYLPQDMIGLSVFDFYHIDDMPHLKDIYELVVKEHGSSFRSKPYRFKVQNGCYIMLETEWSCFINPWSHKLEFVVVQHRVLKGPSNVDIFDECEMEENVFSGEILKEGQKIQREIKTILSEPMKNFGTNKRRFSNKRKLDLASFVYNNIDEGYVGNKPKRNSEKQNMLEEKSNSDPDSVVMGDISPYREVNDSSTSSETPPTIQQLRYQENIERFFASRPKTYSDGSDEYNKNTKSQSSGEDYQGSTSGSGNGSGNILKEPATSKTYENKNQQESSSNSSKCNKSSFTTGDSGYSKSLEKKDASDPTVSHAGSSSQTWKNSIAPTNNSVDNFSSCMALTEEILSAHNRINHKHLKQNQRKNKSLMGHSNATKDSSWFQPKDVGHNKHKKSLHNRNVTVSTPMQTDLNVNLPTYFPLKYQLMPVPVSATEPNSASSPIPQETYSCFMPPSNFSESAPIPFHIPVIYMGSVPYYPSQSTVHHPAPAANFPFSIMSHSGFPFPICPIPGFNTFSGLPFGVQSSGVTATSPFTTTTTTIASGGTHTFHNKVTSSLNDTEQQKTFPVREKEDSIIRKAKVKSTVNECDMHVTDTRSSFQSSAQHSADKEDMDFKIKKCCTSPPRCNKVELSSEIAYRYQMDIPNMDDILKKDMEILKAMQQSKLVNKQLQMLQNEIKSENEKLEGDFYMTEQVMLGMTAEEEVKEANSVTEVGPSSTQSE